MHDLLLYRNFLLVISNLYIIQNSNPLSLINKPKSKIVLYDKTMHFKYEKKDVYLLNFNDINNIFISWNNETIINNNKISKDYNNLIKKFFLLDNKYIIGSYDNDNMCDLILLIIKNNKNNLKTIEIIKNPNKSINYIYIIKLIYKIVHKFKLCKYIE